MSGGKTQTTTTAPPQYIQNAQKGLLSQAQSTAATPYQAYTGQLVSPLTDTQNSAISGINGLQGIQNPYLQSAQNYLNQSSTISPQAIQGFESPYTQDVVNATQAQFNNQNAMTNNGIIGNAIASGAWGGDRAGVAQGIAAGQEATAQAPVIAGLENQGYQTALSAAQNQAQLQAQAGYGMAGLGQEAVNTGLSSLGAQLQAGGVQQQQGQNTLNTAYQQWLNQQQYPFQTTNYLAGIVNGTAGGAGGSTTQPGPSILGQAVGGAEGLAGLAQAAGFFKDGGKVKGYAGGGVPYSVPDDPMLGQPVTLASIVPSAIAAQAARATQGGLPSAPQGQGGAYPVPAATAQTDPTFMDKAAGNPLLQAGLATLSGTSPFAGVNIGRGGLAALQSMQQQRQNELAQRQQQFENQLKTQGQNIDASRLSDEANRWAQQMALETKKVAADEEDRKQQLAQTGAYQQGELKVRGQEAATAGAGSWVTVGTDPASGNALEQNTKSGAYRVGNIKFGAKPGGNGMPTFGSGVSGAAPWTQSWGP